mgnify:CR=1 FL=1
MAFLLATLILAQALVIAMAAAVAGKAQKPAAGDKKKNNKYDECEVGQDILSDQKFVYEVEWQQPPVAPTKVTPNKNGVTGWAFIKASTNPAKKVGDLCRFHLCAHNPCLANWQTPGKYGLVPAPTHIQKSALSFQALATKHGFGAAEAAVVEAAAAGSSSSTAEPAVVEAAVAEEEGTGFNDAEDGVHDAEEDAEEGVDDAQDDAEEEAEEEDGVADAEEDAEQLQEASSYPVMPQVTAPSMPQSSVLPGLNPAAPASLIESEDEGEAIILEESLAMIAYRRNRSTLLRLARDIRTPGRYVGYSAFILMALLKGCQPKVWEGSSTVDLLEVFAPWKRPQATRRCLCDVIACSVMHIGAGQVRLAAISKENPLSQCRHFVAGRKISATPATSAGQGDGAAESSGAEAAVAGRDDFESSYNALGVSVWTSILDGNCAFDVMLQMLGEPSAPASWNELRIELSDYLFARAGDAWMHRIMGNAMELEKSDVATATTGASSAELQPSDFETATLGASSASLQQLATPPAAAAAVPDEPVEQEAHLVADDPIQVDEETVNAIRWATRLTDDANVLSLISELPKGIIDDKIDEYRARDTQKTPGVQKGATGKFSVGPKSQLSQRRAVAARYHQHITSRDLSITIRDRHGHERQRLAWGALKQFIDENVVWTGPKSKNGGVARYINRWYKEWQSNSGIAAAAGTKDVHEKSLLKSRRKKTDSQRKRTEGAGCKFQAPLVRKELYEWWSGLRHAIDWRTLIADRRSRGKKHLARFPRSLVLLKVQSLLQDHAYASLIGGVKVKSFTPDGWWLNRWQEEYGLSFRKANRKYEVPKWMQKERLEVFWVTLFTLRLVIHKLFGYDPIIVNFDQSPFHNNETGNQDKPTLNVRCAKVPIIEGKCAVKERWTANLTTVSRIYLGQPSDPQSQPSQSLQQKPFHEIMFKGATKTEGTNAIIHDRLQKFVRDRGFPSWMTVTTAPKGSYREQDVIEFLKTHLDEMTPGRDWRILLADDYRAHKTQNVWQLAWSRGYVLVIHGGGNTPVAQTCDTDLNQHVRRFYGNRESALLLEKMRNGATVPVCSHEESLQIMYEILSSPELHSKASEGYKKTGQSVDLWGAEDSCIVREAGDFWNSMTSRGHPSMRAYVDEEMLLIEDEMLNEGFTWDLHNVKRLIRPYTVRKKYDDVLERLGEDFYHDDIEDELPWELAAEEAEEGHSDDSDSDSDADEPEAEAAVAEDINMLHSEGGSPEEDRVVLSAQHAEAVHLTSISIEGLQAGLDTLHSCGALRAATLVETQLKQEKKRQRALLGVEPAVAEAFLHRQRVEEQRTLKRMRMAAELNAQERRAAQAIADQKQAEKKLSICKKKLREQEHTQEAKHAWKTFTLAALGKGMKAAGGQKGKKARLDALERLSSINTGLSAAQRNDWPWFKEAWDTEMLKVYGDKWPETFAGWIQKVLADHKRNAFSVFVYSETCRVFHSSAALHIPGC